MAAMARSDPTALPGTLQHGVAPRQRRPQQPRLGWARADGGSPSAGGAGGAGGGRGGPDPAKEAMRQWSASRLRRE
jgi:hypothetical protein